MTAPTLIITMALCTIGTTAAFGAWQLYSVTRGPQRDQRTAFQTPQR